MPIHLPPISRRRFLACSAAAVASAVAARLGLGASTMVPTGVPTTQPDAGRFLLISDLHLDADPAVVDRGMNMAANFGRVADEVLAANARPFGVICAGDLAHNLGAKEDYAQVLARLKPLREAGMPIHLTLGNHDQREHFIAAFGAGEKDAVADKVVSIVESPLADWFILDSLIATKQTPGAVGEQQLKWLAGALDQDAKKPAIIVVHHQPDEAPKTSGLTDTAALLAVLTPRSRVKALFFGHTHAWSFKQHASGIHLVNLPPTSYLFAAGPPIGWVDMNLTSDAARITLHALDKNHPQHGEKKTLAWRA